MLKAVMPLSFKDFCIFKVGIKLNGAMVNNLRFADDSGLLTRNGLLSINIQSEVMDQV